MTLSREDKHSATWAHIKKYLEDRLQKARERNDGELDEKKTARLRGRIAEIKDLLNLGDDKPQIAPDDFKD